MAVVRIARAAATACALCASSAAAGPVVAELFASRGRSARPPADAVLGALAAWPGVIARALHVDYWDHLGGRDRFADPADGARQRRYAQAMRSGTVFTPQLVVGRGGGWVRDSEPWRFGPQTVALGRGENRDRRIACHNVARTSRGLCGWSGAATRLRAPRPAGARGVAVLVQRRSGVVLGAGKLEF